ncbi:MAG: 3-hydroxybutyryl-CoA dehydrogenase [Sutterellaceae bacterium]|uniref:3-hydroxybutyryl-CoA dehydrogenase n=1 Tax=Limnobacter sp. UBA7229 TaxID=1946762 RepID=UPI000C4D9F3D|nr:3-hydroxybutyryl-CoA dehydrogenase [Limnobacter sp. UBA7229]MAG81373.1 3-hydroxybutyryl-CoA dehydrogenase [Sutterellaceae bacterium]MBT83872.1 3-hydroxybutyryl-CoA dehydrogenase [Sutterellaceae bacterium]
MNIKCVGVIGAGTMGSGIAQVCAQAGFSVVMIDVSTEALNKGLSVINGSLSRLVNKGLISDSEMSESLVKVRASTSYDDLRSCELVIEAATENLDLKKKILKQIDQSTSASTILATNTSSLSVTELAACVTHSSRFVGMHFFNPVPVMKLVEVIVGMQTSQETKQIASGFVERIGKQSIVAKNSPGFAVNRILCPMINEAIFACQEGLATASDIDDGMRLGCNHPIGPLALADLIGLDTLLSVMESFYREFADPKYRPAPLLREMVLAGYLGRKSGRGFYQY